jgi:hypothetical protein
MIGINTAIYSQSGAGCCNRWPAICALHRLWLWLCSSGKSIQEIFN